MMFSKYFEYYAIILRGPFFGDTLYIHINTNCAGLYLVHPLLVTSLEFHQALWQQKTSHRASTSTR